MNFDNYIGDPWVSPGHDCWGFVRRVYLCELGIELPKFVCDATSVREVAKMFYKQSSPLNPQFRRCEPKNFAIVLIKKVDQVCHVGLYYEGRILHCALGVGVCFEVDISPYSVVDYYEYVG